MEQMNSTGLVVDPLMRVSDKIKTAVSMNRILVKEQDKTIRSLEHERRLRLNEIKHMQNHLRCKVKVPPQTVNKRIDEKVSKSPLKR